MRLDFWPYQHGFEKKVAPFGVKNNALFRIDRKNKSAESLAFIESVRAKIPDEALGL